MYSEYTIDPRDMIIYALFKGAINSDEMIAHMQRVEADPKFKYGMNTLADLRDADINMNYDTMDKIREYWVSDFFKKRGPVKLACLISDKQDAVVLDTLNVMQKVPGGRLDLRIFTDRKNALEWLKGA